MSSPFERLCYLTAQLNLVISIGNLIVLCIIAAVSKTKVYVFSVNSGRLSNTFIRLMLSYMYMHEMLA